MLDMAEFLASRRRRISSDRSRKEQGGKKKTKKKEVKGENGGDTIKLPSHVFFTQGAWAAVLSG